VGSRRCNTRFPDWQTDRRGYRQAGHEGDPPRFREYFDPGVESVAALLHSGMGAGAAVLFGTTGQISGAYAAIVVGLSAPVLLTQLSRVQSIGDALTGVPPQPPVSAVDMSQQPSTLGDPVSGDPAQASGDSAVGRLRSEPRNGRPVTYRDIPLSSTDGSIAGRAQPDVPPLLPG